MPSVLIVATQHQDTKNPNDKLGWRLDDVSEFYDVIAAKGWNVDIASPAGGLTSFDPETRDDASSLIKEKAKNSLELAKIDANQYDVLYCPGGWGSLYDLVDSACPCVASMIYLRGGLIAAKGHGVAGLLNAKLPNGTSLLHGKDIMISEINEDLPKDMKPPVDLQDELQRCGVRICSSESDVKRGNKDIQITGRVVLGNGKAMSADIAKAILDVMQEIEEDEKLVENMAKSGTFVQASQNQPAPKKATSPEPAPSKSREQEQPKQAPSSETESRQQPDREQAPGGPSVLARSEAQEITARSCAPVAAAACAPVAFGFSSTRTNVPLPENLLDDVYAPQPEEPCPQPQPQPQERHKLYPNTGAGRDLETIEHHEATRRGPREYQDMCLSYEEHQKQLKQERESQERLQASSKPSSANPRKPGFIARVLDKVLGFDKEPYGTDYCEDHHSRGTSTAAIALEKEGRIVRPEAERLESGQAQRILPHEKVLLPERGQGAVTAQDLNWRSTDPRLSSALPVTEVTAAAAPATTRQGTDPKLVRGTGFRCSLRESEKE